MNEASVRPGQMGLAAAAGPRELGDGAALTPCAVDRPAIAWLPLGVVAAVDGGLLAATVNLYGYDRDELYFRILASHPAWGYIDQPPLTPMLVKAGIAVLGDNLWAVRVPAMVLALAAIVLIPLLARELGGGAAAQVLAATGASCVFTLIAGHVLLTATPDLVVWLLAILFAARALLRGQSRWWLAVGLTVGLGLYNKQLILLLIIGVFAGLLVAGPRRELLSPWLWAGAAIALLVGLPNLIYQVGHHWPEAAMAKAIAAHKGADDRTYFLPFQLILLGLPLVPIWITGLIHLLRNPALRPVRALAWAYPGVCLIVLVTGGQPYYTFGLLAFLYAAGCVVVARWAQGHARRLGWIVTAVSTSALTAVVIALPVIPARSTPSIIAQVNQTAGDSIGWPTYVRQVADIYQSLPAVERDHTVVITDNYGEAGALDRYGRAYGLPPVYSGQNQLYYLGPPPQWATVAIVVGIETAGRDFATCAVAGTLDNGIGVDNEEQGRTVTICRTPRQPWSELWPAFQHYD